LNRVKSGRYPNTIAKVCLQRQQFSCWNSDDPNRPIIQAKKPGSDPIFDGIFDIAVRAVSGVLPSLALDALHYHAKGVNPSWVKNSPGASLVARIGSHLFWRGIN